MKYHDIPQNGEEWFQLRAGKLTSSKLGIVMANACKVDKKTGKDIPGTFDPKKAFGIPAKKYAVNIAVEQITGTPIESDYSNDHMARGHAEEPIARELYESETFSEVQNGGFFCSDSIGCSPDGLISLLDTRISERGVIEIKSVLAHVHFGNIKRGGFNPAYKWQCIANLKFTESDWIDFISYCATFPEGKQLFVYRGHKEQFVEEFKQIDERVEEFLKYVASVKDVILNSNYFNQG